MKILIACEESQTVCKAFRALGFEAYSCDIQECSGGHPEWHIQWDAIEEAYSGKYDMIIAHPPCTYLCVPWAHYLHTREGRWEKMLEWKEFFMKMLNAPIKFIAVENPVPHRYAELPKYDQIIHPWQFGQEFSKRTCLWLKNLPKLIPTDIRENHWERYYRLDGSSSNSKWYAWASPKERSKTFQWIADAMASQWSSVLPLSLEKET